MALAEEKNVTYADYLGWDEDARCEVLDGGIISLNFSPSENHQIILGNLHFLFRGYFEGKSCRVMMAPFDVCLFADKDTNNEEIDNFVQPDLFVKCDKSQFDGQRLLGAPDLAIEVLSPSNPKNDKIYKLRKYEQAGVKEYWIVDPNYEIVEVYLLREGRLRLERTYAGEETVTVDLFRDLSIDLNRVFTE